MRDKVKLHNSLSIGWIKAHTGGSTPEALRNAAAGPLGARAGTPDPPSSAPLCINLQKPTAESCITTAPGRPVREGSSTSPCRSYRAFTTRTASCHAGTIEWPAIVVLPPTHPIHSACVHLWTKIHGAFKQAYGSLSDSPPQARDENREIIISKLFFQSSN